MPVFEEMIGYNLFLYYLASVQGAGAIVQDDRASHETLRFLMRLLEQIPVAGVEETNS